jgi:hypothetical protein
MGQRRLRLILATVATNFAQIGSPPSNPVSDIQVSGAVADDLLFDSELVQDAQ